MKKIMSKEVEDSFVLSVIKACEAEEMTITNVKKAMKKVYKHLENNAKL